MIEKGSQEWRAWTFSQREGEVSPPEALQTGALTTKFKHLLWEVIDVSIESGIDDDSFDEVNASYMFKSSSVGIFWEKFWRSYKIDILGKPHDWGKSGPIVVYEFLKKLILGDECHAVMTTVEYMLRHPNMFKTLQLKIESCFNETAYSIDTSADPVCIIPTTSKEMKECVSKSLENINQSELHGAKSHLGNASKYLNDNKFADSIRESIHAVESTAREIDSGASKTLKPALDSLEKKGMLKHHALKVAFEKLYGYTSDEKGIRHALVYEKSAKAGFDEAIFMYAACVAFVDYLAGKQTQLTENENA